MIPTLTPTNARKAVRAKAPARKAGRTQSDAQSPNSPARTKAGVRTNAEMTAETTRNILRATRTCLAELGYAGTTLSVICERVNISRAALLYHFGSKDALMVAAITAIFEDLQSYYHDDVDTSVSIGDRILAILNKSYVWTQSSDHTALMELSLAARRSPTLGALVNAALHLHNSRFDVEWEALLARKGIAAERAAIIRDFGVSTLRGLAVSRLLKGDQPSIERQKQMLTQIVLDAISQPL
ncbi:MAG: TetR/AcrR family transcriptional regulator [Betaproteobacteria bacterium]|nr:MAG: TetR/AcrR family transcriptional regulator [Betaproteobacteria bacterium]